MYKFFSEKYRWNLEDSAFRKKLFYAWQKSEKARSENKSELLTPSRTTLTNKLKCLLKRFTPRSLTPPGSATAARHQVVAHISSADPHMFWDSAQFSTPLCHVEIRFETKEKSLDNVSHASNCEGCSSEPSETSVTLKAAELRDFPSSSQLVLKAPKPNKIQKNQAA